MQILSERTTLPEICIMMVEEIHRVELLGTEARTAEDTQFLNSAPGNLHEFLAHVSMELAERFDGGRTQYDQAQSRTATVGHAGQSGPS